MFWECVAGLVLCCHFCQGLGHHICFGSEFGLHLVVVVHCIGMLNLNIIIIIAIFIIFLNYILGFLKPSSSGSANAQFPGCFRPWTFSLNIGLNMFSSDSFMSCLQSLLGYSTGEFQALQLSLRCLVPWINHLPPVCWSFFKNNSRFVSLT